MPYDAIHRLPPSLVHVSITVHYTSEWYGHCSSFLMDRASHPNLRTAEMIIYGSLMRFLLMSKERWLSLVDEASQIGIQFTFPESFDRQIPAWIRQ
jgi:hypothetical protein